MRRFIIPALLCLALPGLAAAQTAAGNPAGPPPIQQTAPATPDTDAGPTDAPMHGKHAAMMQKWRQQFAAANTSHDGHLTLAQAQAAQLRPVTANFAAIDTRHRGYVTFDDIQAWHMESMAQKLQQRAAALRAQDN